MQPLRKAEVAGELVGVSAPSVQRMAAAMKLSGQERQKVIELPSAPEQLALGLSVAIGPNLSDRDRAEAQRRYAIIEPLVVPDKFSGLWGQCDGLRTAVVALLAGQHQVSQTTIYHWLKAWRASGVLGLVIRDRKDKGRPRSLNGAALEFLLAAALPKKGGYGALTVAEIHRCYCEEAAWREARAGKPLGEFDLRNYARYLDGDGRLAPAGLLPAASYETMRTWFKRIPEIVRVMGREGLEAFSNTQEIISFRDVESVEPMAFVVLDHRLLDIFSLIPVRGGWTLARPWLTAAIDLRTRRWLAWAIVEVPSSDSIATVLKRVFLDFGLPAGIYVDHGKDFSCSWFEGRQVRSRQAGPVAEFGPEWRGVLETLGVRVHHALVRNARAKIIEPNFRRTAEWDRSSPWFCGHNPMTRPERFEALLDQHEKWLRGEVPAAFPTISDVAALYSDALEMFNERPLRGGEGMRKITAAGDGWLSPREAWDLLIGTVPKRTVDPATLAFVFQKRRMVTVRHGEVQTTFAGGQRYHYRLLDNPQGLMILNGCAVEFAYDPLDLEVVALYREGRFVGLAGNSALRKMGERLFVDDEKVRRASRREVKKAIDAAHEVYVPGVVERAARRAAVRPARIEPPRVEVPAELPAAVVAAAKAAEEGRRFCFAGVDAAQACRDADSDDDGSLRFYEGDK